MHLTINSTGRRVLEMSQDDLLAERNQLSAELTQAQLALEPLAGVYDAFLKVKGEAWCRHWALVPLNQLRTDGVSFRMPTLDDCRRAKAAAEGEQTDHESSRDGKAN
jgi:hypothetical protein